MRVPSDTAPAGAPPLRAPTDEPRLGTRVVHARESHVKGSRRTETRAHDNDRSPRFPGANMRPHRNSRQTSNESSRPAIAQLSALGPNSEAPQLLTSQQASASSRSARRSKVEARPSRAALLNGRSFAQPAPAPALLRDMPASARPHRGAQAGMSRHQSIRSSDSPSSSASSLGTALSPTNSCCLRS